MDLGWLKSNVMAAPMTFSYARGEMLELAAELRALHFAGIREEWSDAILALLLAASEYAPLDWVPVLPGFGLQAARKFIARMGTWERIFRKEGLIFHRRYLVGGGNYEKPAKVRAALALARAEQGRQTG